MMVPGDSMSHPSDTPMIDAALPGHATQRDVQRAALAELVSLLTESATSESEIEARHAQARDELGKLTERSQQDIDHSYTASREEIEQTYAAKIAEVDQKFGDAMQQLGESND